MREWEIETIDFTDLADLVELAKKLDDGCGALLVCGNCRPPKQDN